MTRILLNHGANINAKDDEGKTPLDFAKERAERGNSEPSKLILAALEAEPERRRLEHLRLLQAELRPPIATVMSEVAASYAPLAALFETYNADAATASLLALQARELQAQAELFAARDGARMEECVAAGVDALARARHWLEQAPSLTAAFTRVEEPTVPLATTYAEVVDLWRRCSELWAHVLQTHVACGAAAHRWSEYDEATKRRAALESELRTAAGELRTAMPAFRNAHVRHRLHLNAGNARLVATVRAVHETLVAQLPAATEELERMRRASQVTPQQRQEAVDRTLATRKALQSAKNRLRFAVEERRLDQMSDADVAAAEGRVKEARAAYETALRELMALVDLGFGELASAVSGGAAVRDSSIPQIELPILEEALEEGTRMGTLAVWRIEVPRLGTVVFKETADAREANALWQLRHPNIVELLRVCPRGLVLEHMAGGSLGALLHVDKTRLERPRVLALFHDVCKALAFVHERNVLHLDLKSDNVLLNGDRAQAKLADFGSAREQRVTMGVTRIELTALWCAPEALASPPLLTAAADVWSAGMVLYEMCTNRLPYDGDLNRGIKSIVSGECPPLEGASSDLCDMMRGAWQQAPPARPSSRQLLERVETLMSVTCGICYGEFGLKDVAQCSNHRHARCVPCLLSVVESNAATFLPDGSLPCSLCPAASFPQLALPRWTRALFAWRETQLNTAHQAALERQRIELTQSSLVTLHVAHIRERILIDRCPGCALGPVGYDGGCFAMRCPRCDTKFCAYCFAGGHDNTHTHVQQCEHNTHARGDYNSPASMDPVEYWNQVQTARHARLKARYLQDMSEELRAQVEEELAK